MALLGDIYEVKLFAEFISKQVLNVFHYQAAAAPGSSLALRNSFVTDVVNVIRTIQVENIHYDSVEVANLNDPSDFASEGLTATHGAIGAEGLPPYAAYTFKYARATRAVRNGFKRIGGIPETWQDNGIIDTTHVSDMNTVATALALTLTGSGADVYVPVIARILYPVPNPLHLPGTASAFNITGVSYEHIGTQNTRKY